MARGDGGVYRPKDRPTWYCYVPSKTGRIVHGPFRTETDARREWKALRKKVVGGRVRGPAEERITVSELLDLHEKKKLVKGHKSMASFHANSKAIREAFGTVRAVDLTALDISLAREKWLKDGYAEATTDKFLQALRAAYLHAVKKAKVLSPDSVPGIDLINPENTRQGFVDEETFWKLYAVLPEPYRDVALFAYRSAWRRGEVEDLTWERVDVKEREARLYDSKNGEGRVVPLEAELWEVIQRRKAARPYEGPTGTALSPLVFHRDGKPVGDWRKSWQTACIAVGLGRIVEATETEPKHYKGLLFHDLRRSAVSNMTRAGVPAFIAMAISGHRTRSVFDRYNIKTTREEREAIRATVNFLSAKKSEEPSSATEQLQSERTGRKV